MEKLSFKVPVFEGPLDLMLHLISKHKLDIHDIEISVLLEQYLAYIDSLKAADLEIASEFLEMAARLIYIKTVSLLPAPEEAQELKRELTGQLIEYSQLKAVAQEMAQRFLGFGIYVRQAARLPDEKGYPRQHPPQDLSEAYAQIASRVQLAPPQTRRLSEIVNRRVVSVTSRILYVLRLLYHSNTVTFGLLFDGVTDPSQRVATFLAVLELVKSGRISLEEDNETIRFDRTSRRKRQEIQEGT